MLRGEASGRARERSPPSPTMASRTARQPCQDLGEDSSRDLGQASSAWLLVHGRERGAGDGTTAPAALAPETMMMRSSKA